MKDTQNETLETRAFKWWRGLSNNEQDYFEKKHIDVAPLQSTRVMEIYLKECGLDQYVFHIIETNNKKKQYYVSVDRVVRKRNNWGVRPYVILGFDLKSWEIGQIMGGN